MIPAHCAALMAPVPLSVRRSMITSRAWRRNTLKSAARMSASLSWRVVSRSGSTLLILNGSMRVFMVLDELGGWRQGHVANASRESVGR